MSSNMEDKAARILHMRQAELAKGDPVSLPITASSMFHLPGEPGQPGEFNTYGRLNNPVWQSLEELFAHLEDAEAVAFPSGMAAIAASLFAILKAGDKLLMPSDGYYASRNFANSFLVPFGIAVETRPTRSFMDGGFEGYAAVLVETPSNPGLDLCDIAGVAREAHIGGAVVVADNTTMTPFGQRPLDLGADMVVTADTKAMNGHSDVLFGHVASRNTDLIARLREWRALSGSIPGPFEAWQVHRGLETLELRFARMCSSALEIARRLENHAAIETLRYPGLESHPSFELARRQMQTGGHLIGITLNDAETAEHFINNCPMIQPATSFGGVHTSAERRARWGDDVPAGFIRLSVGCEPLEPLQRAIEEALETATSR